MSLGRAPVTEPVSIPLTEILTVVTTIDQVMKKHLTRCDLCGRIFSLSAAGSYSRTSPCTNFPIHCPMCPISFSDDSRTIWEYNAPYQLTSEHSNEISITNCSLIPGESMVRICISKEEEKALSITESVSPEARKGRNE